MCFSIRSQNSSGPTQRALYLFRLAVVPPCVNNCRLDQRALAETNCIRCQVLYSIKKLLRRAVVSVLINNTIRGSRSFKLFLAMGMAMLNFHVDGAATFMLHRLSSFALSPLRALSRRGARTTSAPMVNALAAGFVAYAYQHPCTELLWINFCHSDFKHYAAQVLNQTELIDPIHADRKISAELKNEVFITKSFVTQVIIKSERERCNPYILMRRSFLPRQNNEVQIHPWNEEAVQHKDNRYTVTLEPCPSPLPLAPGG